MRKPCTPGVPSPSDGAPVALPFSVSDAEPPSITLDSVVHPRSRELTQYTQTRSPGGVGRVLPVCCSVTAWRTGDGIFLKIHMLS